MNGYAAFALAMSGGALGLAAAIPLFSLEWQGLTLNEKRQWSLYGKGLGPRPPLPPRASSPMSGPVLQAPWPPAVHRALKNDEARGCNPHGESEWYEHLTTKQLPDHLYTGPPSSWRGPYGEPGDLARMLQSNAESTKKLKTSAEVVAKSTKAVAVVDVGGVQSTCNSKASGDGGSSASAQLTANDVVLMSEVSVTSKGTLASSSAEAGIPVTQACRRGRGRGRVVKPLGEK